MSKVYVVTRGEYSDYRIVQIFGDEESAQAYSDKINASSPYAHADVEDYTLRGPDFVMPQWAAQITTVSRTGDIIATGSDSDTDETGNYEGRCETHRSGGRMALEPTEIRTHGDATRVPKSHADAVAKLRAELMGL